MTTEQYSIGYDEGYQAGWNAAMDAKPAQQEPVIAQNGDTLEIETILYTSPQPAQQDIPDLIAGALGVSRGTAYDMMREALAEQPAQQEPVFWYKPYPNGMYNGPIHNAQIGDVLRGSEEWIPLYTSPPAQRKPLTDEDCTRIYNEANGITIKNPPITTERIFKAMRAAHGIKENT